MTYEERKKLMILERKLKDIETDAHIQRAVLQEMIAEAEGKADSEKPVEKKKSHYLRSKL